MKRNAKPVSNSQNGIMLWHGMTLHGLARLMSRRPALHVSRLHRILSLPFSGTFNSILSGLESVIYSRAVQKTEIRQAPLFILGYWRSGTTLLHNLFCRDPNYQHLTTYRMLFPSHFLLTEKLVTRVPLLFQSRPMDNIKVSWNSPQEDELALCVMGQVSVMLLMSHPHDLSHFWSSLDFSRLKPREIEEWKQSLLLLVKKLTYRDPRPLVLKSPTHTYHIPQLLELFPDARFVFIHRDPYHVFRSTLHLRRQGIQENCLGRSRFEAEGHEEDIIKSYLFGFETYERDRRLIPDGRLHEVAFENLEQSPIDEMRIAYQSLGLNGFDRVERSINEDLEKLKSYRKNSFEDDPYWMKRVYEELQPAYERFGYPEPDLSEVKKPVCAA